MFRFIVRTAATVAALTVALVILALAPANARVAQVDGPDREVMHHNRVTFVTHVRGTNYHYVELRDGSEWMATPCRTEDSADCWHDDGSGWSFLNINGHLHRWRYR